MLDIPKGELGIVFVFGEFQTETVSYFREVLQGYNVANIIFYSGTRDLIIRSRYRFLEMGGSR